MKPTDWGWILKDAMLYPVLTDLPPAPVDILKVIKCSCMGGGAIICDVVAAKMACYVLHLAKTVKGLVVRIVKTELHMTVITKIMLCNTRGNELLFPFYYFSCSLNKELFFISHM